MFEKIKAFAGSVKDVVLYILTPLAFIAGYIFFLIQKNHRLEDEVRAKDGETKLGGIRGEKKQIDAAAADLVSEYEKLRRLSKEP